MALLEIADLTKAFPGVVALDRVCLSVEAGQVHALLGENGAGKSTLLKIVSGAQPCDSGDLTLDGGRLAPGDTPVKRQNAGISTIYQEFNLQPFLTVAENMYLGREPVRFGLIDRRRMREDAQRVLTELGLDLDPDTEVRDLGIAGQQMVEIARAMTLNARLIIMDEPTAALSDREVGILHGIIHALKARGVAVIYVSHRLKEVMDICDAYTVLRDGRFVATGQIKDIDVNGIVRLMVGRDVEFVRRPPHKGRGEIRLRLEGLRRGRDGRDGQGIALHDIGFEVRAGEILGLAGLVGAGRTELARLVFGADRKDGGRVSLNGQELTLNAPCDALKAGIAMVPEDRKQQGCFLDHSIRHNLSLPSLGRFLRWGLFIDEEAERALVETWRQRLGIRMANDRVAIRTLSGGNQQKVLLARCLALSPQVLIVDEPTRGIDIGAKADVHQLLFELADAGMSIIVISSELPEVMAVSDRIAAFREGRLTGVLDNNGIDEETLMHLMTADTAA